MARGSNAEEPQLCDVTLGRGVQEAAAVHVATTAHGTVTAHNRTRALGSVRAYSRPSGHRRPRAHKRPIAHSRARTHGRPRTHVTARVSSSFFSHGHDHVVSISCTALCCRTKYIGYYKDETIVTFIHKNN